MFLHGRNIKIFAGTSNPLLAKEIADCLELPMGKCHLGTFSDGEIAVSIDESVRGNDCFIIQSTCAPVNDNIMEMLILIDALKRASASRITAVIPYFGYARQDRKTKARDPISAKLVADLITTAGANRLLTLDLHAQQIQGFFTIPVDHLIAAPIISRHLNDFVRGYEDEFTIVSPDLGSVTRSRAYAARLACPLAIIDKRRPRANECEVMNIIGNVKGKKAIIVDDMIDTAGTLCNAAEALIKIGGATEVYAVATHGVLSGKAVERINDSYIRSLLVTNSTPITEKKKELKSFQVLTVAPLIAKAIRRIYEDKPMSAILN